MACDDDDNMDDVMSSFGIVTRFEYVNDDGCGG